MTEEKISELLRKLEREELIENHRATTRQSYSGIIRAYLGMLKDGKIKDFQGYLDHIAAVRRVSGKSMRVHLNAGVFFCKKVIGKEPPRFRIPPCKSTRRVPVFLTHEECLAIFSKLDRINRLQCMLMYGCGLRVSECFSLRLKDIDFNSGMLTVRSGKGDKDRTVQLPDFLREEIMEQIRRCKRQWERDQPRGIICPVDSPSLMRKLSRDTFTRLPWAWLFPSRVTRGDERWHATTKGLSVPLREAASLAGIIKRVTPHVFRHSYATNLLRDDVDIRTIQEQLGHEHVETTEIYTHAVGKRGTRSPLDRTAAPAMPNLVHFQQSA